jgi:hypothetical protein
MQRINIASPHFEYDAEDPHPLLEETPGTLVFAVPGRRDGTINP